MNFKELPPSLDRWNQPFLSTHRNNEEPLRNACNEQLKCVAAQQDMTLGISYGVDLTDFRDSVMQNSGRQGHNLYLEEFANMVQLDAYIIRAKAFGTDVLGM